MSVPSHSNRIGSLRDSRGLSLLIRRYTISGVDCLALKQTHCTIKKLFYFRILRPKTSELSTLLSKPYRKVHTVVTRAMQTPVLKTQPQSLAYHPTKYPNG